MTDHNSTLLYFLARDRHQTLLGKAAQARQANSATVTDHRRSHDWQMRWRLIIHAGQRTLLGQRRQSQEATSQGCPLRWL